MDPLKFGLIGRYRKKLFKKGEFGNQEIRGIDLKWWIMVGVFVSFFKFMLNLPLVDSFISNL